MSVGVMGECGGDGVSVEAMEWSLISSTGRGIPRGCQRSSVCKLTFVFNMPSLLLDVSIVCHSLHHTLLVHVEK